jgi:hypothetical protein
MNLSAIWETIVIACMGLCKMIALGEAGTIID